MLRCLITAGRRTIDYTKYVLWDKISIAERVNVPTQVTIPMTPSDAVFTMPVHFSYVQIYSTVTDRNIFTGFVSNEPSKQYLALAPAFVPQGGQLFSYSVVVTSDEYLLQTKSVPFIPAFINRSQGDILSTLADVLCPPLHAVGVCNTVVSGFDFFVNWASGDKFLPQMAGYDIVITTLGVAASYPVTEVISPTQLKLGSPIVFEFGAPFSFKGPSFFDTSNVASGDLVPYFSYDPTMSWSEIAKKFGDGSRYRYKARDKAITYQPYGDLPLGIEYNEEPVSNRGSRLFSPKDLNTQVLNVPLINDVTIIGDVEAGNSREDYFIGDGFTANFTLRHKVFRGASSLLLQESWKNSTINPQQWFITGPLNIYDTSVGAMNINVNGSTYDHLGESVLSLLNGLELAGGIDLEHGEFTWNDICDGVVGGLYFNDAYDAQSLLGGFRIYTTGAVVTGASGAAGIIMQPWWVGDVSNDILTPDGTSGTSMIIDSASGTAIGDPIVSQVNHTYVLQTVITAPKYSRYNHTYRTLEGQEFGGGDLSTSGSITFLIQDYDISQIINSAPAGGFYYTPNITSYTINFVEMPPFAAYALFNILDNFNVTADNTTIATMPLGSLSADVGPLGLQLPTGAILPMLPPGSGGYVGGVDPWPSMFSGNIQPTPLSLQGVQQLVLGNGLQLQSAQISPGNEADTLAFYAQTVPAAGTPVKLQTWEAQAAVSRLQDPNSIAEQAFIVGDDGTRSSIITDLNPLPRTSEDCDNAALAFLTDRTGVFYNGTYTCTSLFFKGLTSDLQYWPTVGRYLSVNSPSRGIYKQKMLVTSLNTRILDAATELLQFQIGFGADLHLEKVLKNFVDLAPPGVLTPQDKANPPNPTYIQNVNNAFLPDINAVDMLGIGDNQVVLQLHDSVSHSIEVRLIDTNWGRASYDYIGTFSQGALAFPRVNYDQTWFMRFVGDASGGLVDAPSGVVVTSRRSKVIRVAYPRRPSPPALQASTSTNVTSSDGSLGRSATFQFDYAGDVRNIYGLEVRLADGRIIYQQPAISFATMFVDLAQTPTEYLLGREIQDDDMFFAYFFNHQWSYSEALAVTPPPALPISPDQFEKATFGLVTPLTVENDLTNHYIIKRSGILHDVSVTPKAPPSGGNSILDIDESIDNGQTWHSLFPPSGKIVVHQNQYSVQVQNQFAGAPWNRPTPGGMLRIDGKAIGSNFPGSGIEVVLRWFIDQN